MGLYLQKLCLDNVTDASYLVVSNVMEGVDNAATFGYNVERQNVQIESNRTLPVSDTHTIDLTIIDDKASLSAALLTEWANTPDLFLFRAFGYGGDSFLSFNTPVNLTIPRQYDTIMTRRVLMTYTAPPGYTGTQSNVALPVYAGPNLLSLYKHWEGSAAYLNGFTQSAGGTLTASQSAGVQSGIVTATDASALVSQNLIFPFEGVRLTASVNITACTVPGGYSVGFRCFDDGGAPISGSFQSFTSVQLGRRGISGITPTGTYSIRLEVTPDDASLLGSPTVSFSAPAIRLGFETSYAN